jgi:quercetin dioxygenase-like cupin family protein
MRYLVTALQREMTAFPQVELQTEHFFADGMYARVVSRPAGCLIVGKVHKREHFYIVARGAIRVTTDDGVKDLHAGDVLVSKPGTKRAVLALEDAVCMTVHRNRTESEDLDALEADLVEPEPLALFDSSNRLLIGEKA